MNKTMIRRAVLAGGIAILAAATYGSPERYIADMIWTDDAAPWEKVTAVYVPDTSKPNTVLVSDAQFADLEACRAHIHSLAVEHDDPDLKKGRYDCAIGFYAQEDDKGVTGDYRLTLQ